MNTYTGAFPTEKQTPIKAHYRLTISEHEEQQRIQLSWYLGDKSFDVTETAEPDKIKALFFDMSEEGAEEAHGALCGIYDELTAKNKQSDS